MYRHILIPTDGSELAQKAVEHGLSLAKLLDAKVTAIVIEPSFNEETNRTPGAFEEHARQVKAHAEKVLSMVVELANAVGVPCETMHKMHDTPYEEIVAAAENRGCDLIVMASHGRSGIAAVVLGSVTTDVLIHSTIPVLVYRATHR
jgi:nucleotide-binding universal stress UspA family protein